METTTIETFHRDGYVVMDALFAPDEVDRVCEAGLGNFDELRRLIEAQGLTLGIGIKEGFREVVQRHPRRFEMPYKMDAPEIASMVTGNSRLMETVRAILGPDCACINKSLVLSLPGAMDQGWHVDGGHVSLSEHLPCHCLNVFMPLVDVALEDGPTELRAKSQTLTRDLQKMYLAAFLGKRLGAVAAPCLPRGAALLFDYRTLHRGRANLSGRSRPVLVYTFAKRGFRDLLNFPSCSVFGPAGAGHKQEQGSWDGSKKAAMAQDGASRTFHYRITGPQSVARLRPLLAAIVAPMSAVEASPPLLHAPPAQNFLPENTSSTPNHPGPHSPKLDFVWETTCEQTWRNAHARATVHNRLHNSCILEDKANLAFLQLLMHPCPVLQTYVAQGGAEVRRWAEERWGGQGGNGGNESGGGGAADNADWWVVKAARGNGGRDVWVMTRDNWPRVAGPGGEFADDSPLVIQRYVHRPLLWNGKKFHFRCYSMLLADLTALLYQRAFILTAGREYSLEDDLHRHITNLSINKVRVIASGGLYIYLTLTLTVTVTLTLTGTLTLTTGE